MANETKATDAAKPSAKREQPKQELESTREQEASPEDGVTNVIDYADQKVEEAKETAENFSNKHDDLTERLESQGGEVPKEMNHIKQKGGETFSQFQKRIHQVKSESPSNYSETAVGSRNSADVSEQEISAATAVGADMEKFAKRTEKPSVEIGGEASEEVTQIESEWVKEAIDDVAGLRSRFDNFKHLLLDKNKDSLQNKFNLFDQALGSVREAEKELEEQRKKGKKADTRSAELQHAKLQAREALKNIAESNEFAVLELRISEYKTKEFLKEDPKEVYKKMRDGEPHPRFEVGVAVKRQEYDYEISEEEALGLFIPENLRSVYELRDNEQLSEKQQDALDRAINQMLNRVYDEAQKTLEELSKEELPDDGLQEIIEAGVTKSGKEAEARREQYETLKRDQQRIFETLLDDSELNENDRNFLVEKLETLKAMQEGSLEDIQDFEIERMTEAGDTVKEKAKGTGSLKEAKINRNGEEVEVLIKPMSNERFLKLGVDPTQNGFRESMLATHNAAFLGAEMNSPLVTVKNTEEYGPVMILEKIDGESCDSLDEWYLDESEEFEESVEENTVEDILIGRQDGAPRNYLKDGNKIKRIDFGADMSSMESTATSFTDVTASEQQMNSVFLFMKNNEPVGERGLELLDRWVNSEQGKALRDIFFDMLDNSPEDLSHFKERYQRIVESVTETMRSDETLNYPGYLLNYNGSDFYDGDLKAVFKQKTEADSSVEKQFENTAVDTDIDNQFKNTEFDQDAPDDTRVDDNKMSA